MADLHLPTQSEVTKWLARWDDAPRNSHVVAAAESLFRLIPSSGNLDLIFAKVAALDNLYSTNIRYLYEVAQHICATPDLDQRLAAGDLSVVNEIAKVPVVTNAGVHKTINYYSFATKFCAFSNPAAYSIYDYYIEKVLVAFNRLDPFYDPKALKFRRYPDFDTILHQFRAKYPAAFADISRADLDRYLWLLGKTTFPRTYGKKPQQA